MNLPAYRLARGGSAPTTIEPPFDFDGSVVRLFPLRARATRLQSFIDAYLNVVPPEVAHFRVFSPYVFLAFIYYGKMSLDAANFGWISQNEILFSVPLLWYRRSGRRWQFVDYASATPFIYVDDDFSMSNGREAYGWPKDRIIHEKLASTWATNPESDRILAQFAMMTFSKLYSGERQHAQTLLSIRQHREPLFFRYPFDPRAAWLPWVGLPRVMKGAFDLGQDFAEIMRAFGLSLRDGKMGRDFYARSAKSITETIDPFSKGLWTNNINLKQFRDSEHPTRAAYQALTNSPMIWERITRGGLIGEQAILQGDPTGGVSIEVYDCPSAPIIGSLGLDVAEKHSHRGSNKRILRPVFPMWMQVDMRYERGRTLAWRAHEAGEAGDPRVREGVRWKDSRGRIIPTSMRPKPCEYNTARGAADTQLTGPYTSLNVTLRVLPLLAKKEKLEEFLKDYLSEFLDQEDIDVSPWGSYVYLVVSTYGDISSKSNDVGMWVERDVYAYVPAVLREKGKDGQKGKLLRIVLVPAYGYENGAIAAQTSVEVDGFPAATATIESGTDKWLNTSGLRESTKHTVLSIKTPILPAAGTGQRLEPRLLLEVCEGDPVPAEDEKTWTAIAYRWGQTLKSELERKIRDSHAVHEAEAAQRAHVFPYTPFFGVVSGEIPLRVLTFKQFRDAQNPNLACYQSLVESAIHFTNVQELREITTGLFVRIYQYPSQPIVDRLGLVCMTAESSGGVLSHIVQPVRPFWATCSLDWTLGKNLCVRVGDTDGKSPEKRLADTLGTLEDDAFVNNAEPAVLLEAILPDASGRDRMLEFIKKSVASNGALAQTPKDYILNEVKGFLDFMARANLRPRGPDDEPMDVLTALLGNLARARIRSAELRLRAMNVGIAADTFVGEISEALRKLPWPPGVNVSFDIPFGESAQAWQNAIEAEKSADGVRNTLMAALSYYSLKPYYVIRRACIANEAVRERVFPLDRSFDWEWYDGQGEKKESAAPPPAKSSTETVPTESGS